MPCLVAVGSIEGEDQLMGRCPCGGDWRLIFNEVFLRRRAWVDYIALRCLVCDLHATFEFDVSAFFEPRPGVWGRRLGTRHPKVSRLRRFSHPGPAVPVGVCAVA